MYVGKVCLNCEWKAITEANTGESFLIQNVSDNKVKYIVSAEAPANEDIGGVLLPYQQLAFKKVGGDLYMKKAKECGYICIEKVEEATA